MYVHLIILRCCSYIPCISIHYFSSKKKIYVKKSFCIVLGEIYPQYIQKNIIQEKWFKAKYSKIT